MLHNYMHLFELNSKILTKLQNYVNAKTVLTIGLLAFWSVIIIGTFIEFI